MRKHALLVVAMSSVLFWFAGAAWAGGRFTEVQGSVQANGSRASVGTQVGEGDKIKTGANSKATILMENGSVLKVAANSSLTVKASSGTKKGGAKTSTKVDSGAVYNAASKVYGDQDSSHETSTPTASSGVRGSIYIVQVGTNPQTGMLSTFVFCLDGVTWAKGLSESGEGCVLQVNQWAIIDEGGACQFMGEIPDDMLLELLEMFAIDEGALNSFSLQLRIMSTPPGNKWEGTPDFLEPRGGGGGDDDDDPAYLGPNRDDQGNLIDLQPPEQSELNIDITTP